MNRIACVLLLLLVPTAAADHLGGPLEELSGEEKYQWLLHSLPDVDLRSLNETLEQHTPEQLHPFWQLLDRLVGPLADHCGLGPLTEGDAGVFYDPQGRHLTVFVSYDLLDAHLTPLWDLLGAVGFDNPVPAPATGLGAGVDAGICADEGGHTVARVDAPLSDPVEVDSPSGEPVPVDVEDLQDLLTPQEVKVLEDPREE